MKILAVCLGNICRSPLAEGLLRREAERRGLDWEVASGGTANYHTGKPPHPKSIAVAKARGIDISAQRSYHVSADDLERFDVILAMDRSNHADLLALARTREQKNKVKLLLRFAGREQEEGADVNDPYGGDELDYLAVYEQLERAAVSVIDRLLA